MLRMIAATFVIIVVSFSTFPLSTAIAGQSAIERALESEETPTKSDKELMERFNISRGSIYLSVFASFLDRVRDNPQLKAALAEAKEQGVRIQVTFHSSTGPGVIHIDGEITDDEIINHVRTSISVALAKEQLRKELEQPAKRLGITQGSSEIEEFASFIKRVHANPQLAAALAEAKKQGVRVRVSFYFSVRRRSINIDVKQNDNEIIKYILGE